MAQEYRIRIQNELTVDSHDVTRQNNPVGPNGIQKSNSGTKEQSPSEALALYTFQKASQTIISNFGALTGDSIQAAYLNNASSLVTDIIAIAKFGWAGVAMAVVDVVSKTTGYVANKNLANRDAEQLRIRTGGSRG